MQLLLRPKADGASYLALEFTGPGVATLSIGGRIVTGNVLTEALLSLKDLRPSQALARRQ